MSLGGAHHLSLLGHLLDLGDELLLLSLQALPLPLDLPDGFIQHPLVLPQQLCMPLTKNEFNEHKQGRRYSLPSGSVDPDDFVHTSSTPRFFTS